jgi:hypothetical protein
MRPALQPRTTRSLLAAAALTALTALGGCHDDPATGQAAGELSDAQCAYFAAAGKVTVCHHTGSARKPYHVLTVDAAGCGGHADHDGDYVAYGDPTCNGQGCRPAGAPHDGTVECCEGLAPQGGLCAPVQPACDPLYTCVAAPGCPCDLADFAPTYAVACGDTVVATVERDLPCDMCECPALCAEVCGAGSQFLGGPHLAGSLCAEIAQPDGTCGAASAQCNCTIP